jgi:hypothetical protein
MVQMGISYTSLFIAEKWFGRCPFVFASPESCYQSGVRYSMGEDSNTRIEIHTHTDCFLCQEVQLRLSQIIYSIYSDSVKFSA